MTHQSPKVNTFQYKAFISYSHADTAWGEWLRKRIETYRVPSSCIRMNNDVGKRIEPRLGKIFRDRDELNSGPDLNEAIRAALEASENLIIICSPKAAQSKYVNQEIIEFKRLGRKDRVYAFIVGGEPNAMKTLDEMDEECLPAALRLALDDEGQLTDRQSTEVLAADARPGRDGKARAKLKLIAGLLGINFDLLYQRDKRRRRQQLSGLGAIIAVVLAVIICLSWTAYQDADRASREQLKSDHEAYATALNLAEEAYHSGDHPGVVDLLQQQRPKPGKDDLREFAWHYLWRLYDNHRHTIRVASETETSIALSPDSKTLAITGGTRTVTLWDVFTGEQRAKIEDPNDEIEAATFVRDGTAIVTRGKNGTIRIWELLSQQEHKAQTLEGRFRGMERSPDGNILFTRTDGDALKLMDLKSGEEHKLEDLYGHGDISSWSFSPDSHKFALAYEWNAVVLFDTSTGNKTGHIEFERDWSIRDVSFAQDGKLLAMGVSGKQFHEVVLWDLHQDKENLRLQGPDVSKGEVMSVAFSPNSKKVALLVGSATTTSPEQHNEVIVWDTTFGKQLFTLKQEETGFITALQFSPDGEILATGSKDHAVRFWDTSTGSLRNVLGIHHGSPTREGEKQSIHRDRNVPFAKHEVVGGGISDVLFSRDGKTLVSASRVYGTVKIWDTDTEPENLQLRQRPDHYSSIAFSPDNTMLLTGDYKGTITLWDALRHSKISEVVGHLAPVYSLAFSASGDRFASASSDRVVKLWRTATLEQEATLMGPPVRSEELSFGKLYFSDRILVHVVSEGDSIWATRNSVDVKVWDLSVERKPIEISSSLVALATDGIVNLSGTPTTWQGYGMDTPPATTKYKNHRFPVEIISYAVWLYFRFCLSFRDVEELLLERGVVVTYEAIRKWCRKFGQPYATQLRRRRPRPGDKWQMDEVFLTIKGEHHYLWRAVDQDGNVLDILVQRRRDKKAAKKFFRKLLKGLTYVPRVIVTDKLKSYGAAKREILPGVEHRQHRYLNNRAENSHQPTRQRERRMQRFKSPGHAQRFLSAYGMIAQHFRPRRHRFPAPAYRQEMKKRFQIWQTITGTALAA